MTSDAGPPLTRAPRRSHTTIRRARAVARPAATTTVLVLRVFSVALVVSPLVARGNDFVRAGSGGNVVRSVQPSLATPAPTDESMEFAHSPSVAPGAPVPDAIPSSVCYWFASSRHLPQQPSQCRAWHLDYSQRTSDGYVSPTDLNTLLSQLTPGVPVCIFIHGSFVDVESHRRESAATFNWIRRPAPHLPVHVMFYTWPSDAPMTLIPTLDVNQRGRWAANNAFYLTDLIAQLPPSSPVCMVGHSHGARSAVATLHLVAGGSVAGHVYPHVPTLNRRYRAVLAAAAIDRHWLDPGERYGCALYPAEGILNLVNSADWALHFYKLRHLFSRKALATTGFTRFDRRRLGALNPKAVDLDVTPLVGLGHYWPNYFEKPQIAWAISPYVYFANPWEPGGRQRSAVSVQRSNVANQP